MALTETAIPGSNAQISIDNVLPRIGRDNMVQTALEGLGDKPKHLSSMFLYDAHGSRLFEEITEQPEYYPPRIEKRLLAEYAELYREHLPGMDIVELGSGDCSKISIILDALAPWQRDSIRYVPVDISEYAVRQSAVDLQHKFCNLSIHGLIADFMTQLDAIPHSRARLFCFLGSTIGNLQLSDRTAFLDALGKTMQAGDKLLLGVDMIKPVDVLEEAYNDARQVTAAFNRNALNVVNDVAETNFNPEKFEHVAFYNHAHARIEMHVKAVEDMSISSPHWLKPLHVAEGECIHTENSHKFRLQQFEEELAEKGLYEDMLMQDHNQWFSLLQLTKKAW